MRVIHARIGLDRVFKKRRRSFAVALALGKKPATIGAHRGKATSCFPVVFQVLQQILEHVLVLGVLFACSLECPDGVRAVIPLGQCQAQFKAGQRVARI